MQRKDKTKSGPPLRNCVSGEPEISYQHKNPPDKLSAKLSVCKSQQKQQNIKKLKFNKKDCNNKITKYFGLGLYNTFTTDNKNVTEENLNNITCSIQGKNVDK